MIENFASYIKNPYKLDHKSLIDLKELVRKYPFCQTAQVLYLLNLIKFEDEKVTTQRSLTAAYIGNRKLLKNLCDSIKVVSIEEKAPEEEVLPTLKTEIIEEKEEIITEEIKIKEEKDSSSELIDIIQKKLSEINKEKTNIEQAVKENKNKFDKEVKDVNELIEKFLKEQPKIKTPKQEKEFVEDLERSSLSDNDDIISETLASIYEKQGYISKAIKIYNKLSLKFPEKSSYFAKEIQRLKKVNNQ